MSRPIKKIKLSNGDSQATLYEKVDSSPHSFYSANESFNESQYDSYDYDLNSSSEICESKKDDIFPLFDLSTEIVLNILEKMSTNDLLIFRLLNKDCRKLVDNFSSCWINTTAHFAICMDNYNRFHEFIDFVNSKRAIRQVHFSYNSNTHLNLFYDSSNCLCNIMNKKFNFALYLSQVDILCMIMAFNNFSHRVEDLRIKFSSHEEDMISYHNSLLMDALVYDLSKLKSLTLDMSLINIDTQQDYLEFLLRHDLHNLKYFCLEGYRGDFQIVKKYFKNKHFKHLEFKECCGRQYSESDLDLQTILFEKAVCSVECLYINDCSIDFILILFSKLINLNKLKYLKLCLIFFDEFEIEILLNYVAQNIPQLRLRPLVNTDFVFISSA